MAIGVPRPLALEKPQSVDLAQAARYFGAHGEPDAATLSGIGDAVGKINTAIPGYFGKENLRDLTGIRTEN